MTPEKAEYEEFLRERKAVGESEDRGEVEMSREFSQKWLGRYPQFDLRNTVGSLFRRMNRLENMLESKANPSFLSEEDEPTRDLAQTAMTAHFGDKWSMLYADKEQAGVERWELPCRGKVVWS